MRDEKHAWKTTDGERKHRSRRVRKRILVVDADAHEDIVENF